MARILKRMAEFHMNLFQHPFVRLGGLKVLETAAVEVGMPLNEHYIQIP